MSLAVDQAIINDPYREPTRWWDYQQGQPVLMDGRRPAGEVCGTSLRPVQPSGPEPIAAKVIDFRGE